MLDTANPKEINIDEEYSDTLELAMKNPNIDIPSEDAYMRNIDRIIKKFESEEYISLYFISENGKSEIATTFAKFKIKEIEGKEKWYFCYNENLESDVAGTQLTVTLE